MTDVFTQKKRSAVMAAIRSHGNQGTELRLIAILRAHGITGWRRHRPVFGKPDFVFPRSTGQGSSERSRSPSSSTAVAHQVIPATSRSVRGKIKLQG